MSFDIANTFETGKVDKEKLQHCFNSIFAFSIVKEIHMKNILIVAATYHEIKFLEQFGLKKKSTNANLYSFQIRATTFDVLITGVGMVATTFQLTYQFTKSNYHLCINAGIAGAFDKTIHLGETVNIIADCFADIGAEDDENFLSLFDLGFLNENEFPFENGLLKNKTQFGFKAIETLKKVTSATVNKSHGNDKSIAQLLEQWQPATESLEGAAFHFVCLQLKVPFLQIRSISNYIEKRNRSEWKIEQALHSLEMVMIELVKEIGD